MILLHFLTILFIFLQVKKNLLGISEKNSSATLALLLKCSHSATLALLLGAALFSQLPFRGLYRMFIVPLALLIAHNGTAPNNAHSAALAPWHFFEQPNSSN